MGVKGWNIFKPEQITMQDLKGATVGIDTYYLIKRYASRQIDSIKYSVISGILYFVLNLLEHGIVPVFVYDGILPEKNRRISHEKHYYFNSKDVDIYRKSGVIENIEFNFDELIALTRKLLTALGVQHITASEEADKLLAGLATHGNIDYVFSTDRDYLAYGVPKLITKIDFETGIVDVIILNKILMTHEITLEQLRDLAILCGNDYFEGISGIGPRKGIMLLKEYGDLWGVLQKLLKMPEIGMFKARKNYERLETYDLTILKIYPNFNLIQNLLAKIIGKKRTENAIKRLQNAIRNMHVEQQILL